MKVWSSQKQNALLTCSKMGALKAPVIVIVYYALKGLTLEILIIKEYLSVISSSILVNAP